MVCLNVFCSHGSHLSLSNTFWHHNWDIGVTKTNQTDIVQSKPLYANPLQTKHNWWFNYARALSSGFNHLTNELSTYIIDLSIKACDTLHMMQRHLTSKQYIIVQTLQSDSIFIAVNCRQNKSNKGTVVLFGFKCKKGVNKVVVERVKNSLNKVTLYT